MGATSAAELLRDVDTSALGSRIRSERVTRGWTQAQLAGDELSTGYLSRIESGARRPTLTVLTELARRLDVPVLQLLNGTGAEYDEIRLCLDYAELALENGEGTEAENQARRGVTRAELAGLHDFVARGRYLLGRAYEMQDRLDEAAREFEWVVAAENGLSTVYAAIALTRCHLEEGDLALAIATGERVCDRLQELGLEQTDEAVQLALTVAGAYIERGDLHHARRLCEDAVTRAEELASPRARASAYYNASVALDDLGSTQDAITLAGKALALLAEGNDTRNLARLRLELGRMMLNVEAPAFDEAISQLTRAGTELAESSAARVEILDSEVTLAQAHLMAGDIDAALGIAEKVEASLSGGPELRARAMLIRGQAAAIRGFTLEARENFRTAWEQIDSLAPQHREAAQLWFDLAELLEQAGDLEAARAAFRRAAASTGLTPRVSRTAASDRSPA